ncbi:MAG: ABC transporter permease, partial [Gammaproteobacteria bacterium]|nr:ABC transporter permease [Gammaproteobacteria bacterium]
MRTAWPLRIVSIVAFVLVWQLATVWVDAQLLPSPMAVFARFWSLLASGELAEHVGVTLLRVAVSFALAMLIGTAIGLLMGRSGWFDNVFDAWIII